VVKVETQSLPEIPAVPDADNFFIDRTNLFDLFPGIIWSVVFYKYDIIIFSTLLNRSFNAANKLYKEL